MSKICLIADTHLGIKKSSDIFLDSQKRFFTEELIPYLTENKINKLFILGDLFDNRVHTNTKTLNLVHELFSVHLKDFKIYVINGNHDLYFNSRGDVSSTKWLNQFSNVELIDEIKEIEVYKKKILLMPWETNTKATDNFFKNYRISSKLCFGHLNLSGFFFNKNRISENGLSSDLFFDNFDLTFSGHFHIRNKKKRDKKEIVYIGAPYHLTRHDIDEQKGFVILDVNTNEYKFIDSDKTLRFVNLKYPASVTRKMVEGNIIDVEVVYDNDFDEEKVQRYLRKIESFAPAQSPILNITNNLIVDIDIADCEIKSSDELIVEYVSKLTDVKNKDAIYKKLESLHEECKKGI